MTYEGQEPRIVMWAYTLCLAVSLADDGVLHNLSAMLHVRIRVIKLF
jgi:hypothetical protein